MKKVIFLDRDGTLNVDHGYVYQVADWEWVPGAIEGLKRLQSAGYTLAVVTNQSGIGRGYYTEADMHALHEHMEAELATHNISIAEIAFCPHDRPGSPEEVCVCRKPNLGMVHDLQERLGDIDFRNSWVIGDKLADVGLGKNAGTNTALIRSRYWRYDEIHEGEAPDLVVDSLKDAADQIIA